MCDSIRKLTCNRKDEHKAGHDCYYVGTYVSHRADQWADIIAKRHGIGTLERRMNDSLDFHDLGVGTIKSMIMEAFKAGAKHG